MGKMLSATKPIEFGQVGGPTTPTVKVPAKASQVFSARSGKLCSLDSNGYAEVALAADTFLIGGAITGADTTNSSDGGDELVINPSLDALWMLPIDAAKTEAQLIALMWKTCDLVVASDIQYADLDASSTDVIQIVDYVYWGSALGEQAVIVRLNPATTLAGGVA